MMSLLLSRVFVSVQLLAFLLQSVALADVNASYDAGPDRNTEMGRRLIDLNSSIPYFPGISLEVMGTQKFRPAFGPMPWRMTQKPNSVKILFIGQDGTHIAEAAGRPATAGFGGRAQDLAKYFGVGPSAAFINTYAFTIKGQYGGFEYPVVHKSSNGSPQKVSYTQFVDNHLWLITQDLDSPITQWRNSLIDWIIENNKDSLKMIVLFGGAARDAAASYVISKGGVVGTRFNSEELKNIKVPESLLTNSGGNNETPYPVDRSGRDLFARVLGKQKINYKTPMNQPFSPEVKEAQDELNANISKWADEMVFSNGGLKGSGILHPAQLGGFDIAKKMEINGQKTISLKGLKISPKTTLKHDLLVVQLPHPTALSSMKPQEAAQKVGAALKTFDPYIKNGWEIEADNGFENTFAQGEPYKYRRGDMGPETYDFGAPASRMVNVSSASRYSADRKIYRDDARKVNAIVFGTRDKVDFDSDQIMRMTLAMPSTLPSSRDLWTTRPISKQTRYTFDSGPGEKYAKIIKQNIPESLIQKHSINRDYAHYRGTFIKPKVLIVADPDGYDDLITSRALTGTRGQYLHSLMESYGVQDQYLVIKTAPFGKDNESDWKEILKLTQTYREKLVSEILKDSKLDLIITDGEDAKNEIERILSLSPHHRRTVKVVSIQKNGEGNDSGISKAAKALGVRYNGKMSDIPRSHLTYYARVWEGTSGDRVLTSTEGEYRGKAFIEVAPYWAVSQKFEMQKSDKQGIQKLNDKLLENNLRLGTESITEFVKRVLSQVIHWFNNQFETKLAA